jgi:uncharacterized protein YaeQ
MALGATVLTFDIELADSDRHVYESLALKVAMHPSETQEYLWTRVIAYCLEYAEGIAFSKGGVSDPEDPPVMVKDLSGAFRVWVEIGAPDAARLHKAAKASPRVVLYTHKEPRTLLRGYEGARIHRGDEIDVYAVPAELLEALVAQLDRRVRCSLSVSGGELFFDFSGTLVQGALEPYRLPQ